MQLNKNIKIFVNYFLGPLLFVWLSYSIYQQIVHQPRLEDSWLRIRQSFQSYKVIYLLIAICLIPFNWGLEALKWQLSLRKVCKVPFTEAFKAVLSGVSFSVTMPNRVGEYLGRMMYLPEGNRLKTISVTLVGSFAQLLVTIIMGTAGVSILKEELLRQFPEFRSWSQFILYGLLLLTLVLTVVFFNVAGAVSLFRRWIKTEKHLYLVVALESFRSRFLMKLLLLSLVRYIIFMIQYILLFHLFEVNIPAGTILTVMSVVFLALAVIPSIALIEVWLRGEVIIMLMGLFSTNTLGIGFTSVTVWFMNLIFPAIIGSLLILNLRVFNKRNETA